MSLPPEKRHVGVVFQDSLLFPHLTVEGNLRYGQRRRDKRGRMLDFARVVEVLEIGPLLQRSPRNLSGGERQRVALGRALLSGPELLLMDEPLASLDAPLRDRVLSYLERAVAEWNIPTLFVTHAQAEVRRAAQWVVLLEKGRLVGTGTPEDALSQPEPLAWTNSTAPINLLRLEKVESRGDFCTARVGDQVLQLPPRDSNAALPSFVQFSPTDVIIARQEVAGLSVRNRLRGKVCRVIPIQQAIFVAVDIGQIIWAEVTQQAAAELELQPGAEVICLVKTHQPGRRAINSLVQQCGKHCWTSQQWHPANTHPAPARARPTPGPVPPLTTPAGRLKCRVSPAWGFQAGGSLFPSTWQPPSRAVRREDLTLEEAIQKADVLIEALTWIRQFRGKVTVIKLGGSVMENEPGHDSTSCWTSSSWRRSACGPWSSTAAGRPSAAPWPRPAWSRASSKDAATPTTPRCDIVERVLAGEINEQLADQIDELGGRAQPLNFRTTNVLFGERIQLEGNDGEMIDLGHVGRVTAVDRATIENLCDQGIVPVIPSMCITKDGQKLNVNADTAATAVAQALQAEKLVCLSDVNGVRRDQNDPESLIHSLTADQAREMIASGAIEPGMIPKVQACLETLEQGVRKIHIIDGRLRHSLLLEVYTSKGVGTEILKNGRT